MSYIQNGGAGGGGSGTVTHTGNLTANAVVLGNGTADTKVVAGLTTNGISELDLGSVGGGLGTLVLKGTTSGGPNLTTNATGTQFITTSPLSAANGIHLLESASGASSVDYASNSILDLNISSAIAASLVANFFSVGVSRDTGITRIAAGVVGISGSAGTRSALLLSANSVFVAAGGFTTSGVGTALEAITGLSITVPAVATAYNFHAHLLYHQNVGTAAVAFGVQAATNNPTNLMATGKMQTNATAFTGGVLATLATTTATAVVSATPSAITTDWLVDIHGTLENPASANALKILVSTATAADTVTIGRGSYLSICP